MHLDNYHRIIQYSSLEGPVMVGGVDIPADGGVPAWVAEVSNCLDSYFFPMS